MRLPRQITTPLTCLAAATLIALTGCANTNTASAPASVVQLASATPELSTFSKLVKQAGLAAELDAAGPLTVFAPTDEAFKAVPAATLEKLSNDPELLKATLRHHVVAGAVKAADITHHSSMTSLASGKLALSKAGDFVTVDDAVVVSPDLQAGSSIVHTIDRVLSAPRK